MTNRPTGGPAFPIRLTTSPDHHGLTVRDYFAGQVLPVTISETVALADEEFSSEKFSSEVIAKAAAIAAYAIADAMIAERDRS